MVDKEKFGKIQQGYSKNQTCLEKKIKIGRLSKNHD